MNYALREALLIVFEEGLENRFARHKRNAELLWSGLDELGFSLLVNEEFRLPTLTTPILPEDLDDALIRKQLLDQYNIEIAGGFGPLAGKVWRIGLMGFSSNEENVNLLLKVLKKILER
jgi:alanine-glyoxylate transaminase/serine-glyoxylate transaminase/serine-pyruvate transaminase